MNKQKRKIAIVSITLGGGGAERFGGILSTMLFNLGHEIHNIVINDDVGFDYSGSLLNLGKANKTSGVFKKINKGILLRNYLKAHNIDCVIDNRSRHFFLRELFTKWIYGNRKVIYMVHSFNLAEYFPKSVFLARTLYESAKIVCVSKAIDEKVRKTFGFKNTATIYNPVPSMDQSTEDHFLADNYILFFGRLDEKVKNFSLMLEAFSKTNLADNGLVLLLMGDGPDGDLVQQLIEKYNLSEYVQRIPFQKSPFDIVRHARFTILTSRYEGFPMSVVESLASGTPVISVDCDSGPRELIINEFNGLLIPNHNPAALAEAIDKFAHDGNLYDICKKNAASSVGHLSIENISSQWQQILQ